MAVPLLVTPTTIVPGGYDISQVTSHTLNLLPGACVPATAGTHAQPRIIRILRMRLVGTRVYHKVRPSFVFKCGALGNGSTWIDLVYKPSSGHIPGTINTTALL